MGYNYRKYINFDSYKTFDVDKNSNANFCEDLHATKISSDSFDTIIMIEVMEHLYNPFEGIRQVHRILKKDGYVIATTPFIFPYHSEPNDYFRYTEHGLCKLFEEFSELRIIQYGNVFGATIDLLTVYKLFKPLKIFNLVTNIQSFNKFLAKTPLGHIIIAKK